MAETGDVQESSAEIAPSRRHGMRALRLLVFVALAAGLLWAIVTHSLVAAVVEIDPRRALAIRADDPSALLAQIDRTMDQARRQKASPASDAQAPSGRQHEDDLGRQARAILAQEPGNARALAMLGDVARQAGKDEEAKTLFEASARRSLRNPAVLGWLIDDALRRQDWPLAVRHVDTMMRYYWEAVTPLTPLLAKLLQNPEAAPSVVKAVAAAPEWRREFIPRLPDAVTDARVPLELFLALKSTSHPPTARELRWYLNFLIERKFYDLAYSTWLRFLPPEQLASVGPLFNGSFESRPTGLPFDWSPAREGWGTVAIERRADRPAERALVIRFGQGRADLDYLRQLMRLQPGRYRVEGLTMGEMQASRGMRWRVRCVGDQASDIGESALIGGRTRAWTAFSFDVVVPETGCAAQEIRLMLDARTPSEQLVSGTISFDEISVRRLD